MKRTVTSSSKRPRLTSSGLAAAALCWGKPNAEAPFADTPTDESERGVDLHKYFFTGLDYSHLTVEDRELLDEAHRLGEKFIQSFREANGLTESDVAFTLHEIQLYGDVPGKPDHVLLWRCSEFACILDLKSGMLDVDDADHNYQLADYSLLIHEREGSKVIGCAIVQPTALGPRLTQAFYTAEQMPMVKAEVQRINARTLPDDAPRTPGEKQCQFCKAKSACPEYKATFEAIEVQKPLAIETLDNERLEKLKQGCSFANAIEKIVNDELRKRIEEGRMPGWKLKNTGSTREVTDPIQLFEDLSIGLKDHGFTAWEYEQTRETKWGALEALVQKLTGWTQKQAKEYVKQVSAPYVTETPKAKAPVREKK